MQRLALGDGEGHDRAPLREGEGQCVARRERHRVALGEGEGEAAPCEAQPRRGLPSPPSPLPLSGLQPWPCRSSTRGMGPASRATQAPPPSLFMAVALLGRLEEAAGRRHLLDCQAHHNALPDGGRQLPSFASTVFGLCTPRCATPGRRRLSGTQLVLHGLLQRLGEVLDRLQLRKRRAGSNAAGP